MYQQVIVKGVTQERLRIKAILECEEAKEKKALAQHLALNTDLSTGIVQSTLKQIPIVHSPSEQAPTQAQPTPDATSGFTQVMASIDNPRIEPKGEEENDDNNADVIAKRIAQFSTRTTDGGNV